MKLTFRWYLQATAIRPFLAVVLLGSCLQTYSKNFMAYDSYKMGLNYVLDTLDADSLKGEQKKEQAASRKKVSTKRQFLTGSGDTVFVQNLKKSPYISLQQYLKGNVAGLYVQENNGEPGTVQNMIIRGIATPLFSNRDVSAVQPAVYVNGIPLIGNHPFTYDIKQYDFNPLGTGNNLFAGIDLNNVVSIEVIKNPAQLAHLGPLAANGAIWIITNDASNAPQKENISINASYGVVAPPSRIRPTNANYETEFRRQFYNSYNQPFDLTKLPGYLQDTSDPNYFGNANWADNYYSAGQQYNADASIGGGSNIANFLFKIGSTKNAGVADQTSYMKNNIGFFVNMKPLKALQMKAMIYGATANRNRNRNLRDRYAETEYYSDFSIPISPAGEAYNNYLSLYDETVDKNTTNFINGYLKLDYLKGKVNFGTDLLFDYNVDTRHVFWPSTLMESVSFVSDYSGYNRRIVLNTYASYAFNVNSSNLFSLHWDGTYNGDVHHYNYTKAFDGSNDKFKTTAAGGAYKTSNFVDKEQAALLTSSFTMQYDYRKVLSLSTLLQYGGYSEMQSDHKWLFTPSFSGKWNLKEQFWSKSKGVADLSLAVSWARIAKIIGYDRFSVGPNYTSGNLNWEGQPAIPSYGLFATFTRPYANGWSGYDISRPTTDKFSFDLNAAFFKKRLDISISLYNNDDKNMIVPLPVPQEFGYKYQYLSGMQVNNKGIDLTLSGSVFNSTKKLKWLPSLNMNYNKNELKELPNGLQSLTFGDRKLQIGHALDQFWVYENKGTAADGSAKWADVNNDSQIDEKDKVLKGHSLPKFTGGLNNSFIYKKFDLSLQFFFSLGHDALNVRDANRYDFSTVDGENSISGLREIYFWQNTQQRNDYPIYNPVSEIHSYRSDQDLFLEKLSYLKLRSISMGYYFNVPEGKKSSVKKYKPIYAYLIANNVWTLTNFSGGDPELVDFNGYFTGFGQYLPSSLSLGLRYKF